MSNSIRCVYTFFFKGGDRLDMDAFHDSRKDLDKTIDYITSYIGQEHRIVDFVLYNASANQHSLALAGAVHLKDVIGFVVEGSPIEHEMPEVL